MGIVEDLLSQCGWNYDETKLRFMGSDAMIIKFFNRFLNEESYNNLVQAYDEQDRENIRHYAHSLKGVSGNMGLVNLYEACLALQTAADEGKEDLDELYVKVVSEYNKTLPLIKKFLEGQR